jgi:hypothetical protein
MNSTRRRLQVVLAGMGAVVFGAAAFAWACTENASISAFPKSGVAGSTTKVDGAGFTDAPVELRWDAVNGPLLAVTDGPKFLQPVEIPPAGPGVHKIVAVHINPMSGDTTYNTTSFMVVLPEAPDNAQRQDAPGSRPQQGRPQQGQPQAEPQARPEPATAGTFSFGAQDSAGSDRAAVAGSGTGTSPDGLGNGTIDAPPVSERAAFGDATGGFSSAAGPSLTEGATGIVADDESGAPVAAGLALLVLGFAALVGGGFVVARGRRPASAAVEHDRKN